MKLLRLHTMKNRLTFFFLLTLIIPLAVAAWVSSSNSRESLTALAIVKSRHDAIINTNHLKASMDGYKQDILMLANTPPPEAMIRAIQNGGVDPLSEDDLETWVRRFSTILVATTVKKSYQQLRFLDSKGMELVRVDYRDGLPTVVTGKLLQDKSGAKYFKEAMRLQVGEVYISQLNLNREHSKIQVPHTSVVRLSTPVLGPEGKPGGIVVLNVYGDHFMKKLSATEPRQIVLTNEAGYYLYHKESSKRFGFEFGKEQARINNDLKEAVANLGTLESYAGMHDGKIIAFHKVHFDPSNPSRYWLVTNSIPADKVLKAVSDTQRQILLLALLAVPITLITAFALARGISQPLAKAITIVEELSMARLESIPRQAIKADNDGDHESEAEKLLSAMDRMVERLRMETLSRIEKEKELRLARDELEMRVEERTSELKDANTALAKAQQIAHLGSWNWDMVTGDIVWSDEIYRIFGLKPQEFGATYDAFLKSIHPDDRDAVTTAVNEAVEQGKIYSIEHRVIRPDGSERTVHEGGEVFYDDNSKPLRILGTVLDITERKLAEEKIKNYATQLEHANRELEEFNYVASHDLQEPIRTLSSYCTFLKSDIGENIPEKAVQDIDFITDAAKRMQVLVQDLLQLSRAGRWELKSEAVDLNDCAAKAVSDMETSIKEKGGSVKWAKLPTVTGDATHLTRVFQNLIGNALKFHGDNPPKVDLSARQVGGKWEITVSDNGIGIEPQYLEQIFLPFKRLHGMAQYKGSGIGLSVCHKIIRRHGGEITVESEPGKGSRFKFTLKKWIG